MKADQIVFWMIAICLAVSAAINAGVLVNNSLISGRISNLSIETGSLKIQIKQNIAAKEQLSSSILMTGTKVNRTVLDNARINREIEVLEAQKEELIELIGLYEGDPDMASPDIWSEDELEGYNADVNQLEESAASYLGNTYSDCYVGSRTAIIKCIGDTLDIIRTDPSNVACSRNQQGELSCENTGSLPMLSDHFSLFVNGAERENRCINEVVVNPGEECRFVLGSCDSFRVYYNENLIEQSDCPY